MLKIEEYRECIETAARVPAIKSRHLVNDDRGMSDRLRSLKREELPALFTVVPYAEAVDRDPDNLSERNMCILFLMERTDPQRRTSIEAVTDTQPVIEALKKEMRKAAARPCSLMYGMSNLTTTPESGLYAEYAGWSLTYTLTSHE